MSFNTAVSAMMVYVNELKTENLELRTEDWEKFLKILAPFAPHITEELWRQLGNKDSIHTSSWPQFDQSLLQSKTFDLIIQVAGRVRGKATAPYGIGETEATELAMAQPEIKKWLLRQPRKVIYVPNRLINLII